MTHNEQVAFLDNTPNRSQAVGFAARLEEGLHHLGVAKIDEATARGLIDSATSESALLALDYINAAAIGEAERFDHSNVTSAVATEVDGKQIVTQYLLPPRHRKAFMAYALDKAKAVPELHRKANIAAYATVLAHNAHDGNGRTARVAGAVIANGFDPYDAESVTAVNAAATSRPEGVAERAHSFTPGYEVKRSWVTTELNKTHQFDAFRDMQQALRGGFRTEFEKNGVKYEYIDPDKLQDSLPAVQDPMVRERLAGTLQQIDFGAMAALDIIAGREHMNLPEALRTLDDETAKNIILTDEDRKLAYSRFVIDIVAGEPKDDYLPGSSQPYGTITDEKMLGYHAGQTVIGYGPSAFRPE